MPVFSYASVLCSNCTCCPVLNLVYALVGLPVVRHQGEMIVLMLWNAGVRRQETLKNYSFTLFKYILVL
jgi:hypothetical protein